MFTYKELKEKYTNTADRLAYIDFMLRFTGIVKRSDIGEMFNLSDAAASKVLADYSNICKKYQTTKITKKSPLIFDLLYISK